MRTAISWRITSRACLGPEALNDQALPGALLKEWEGKKLATPPNGKVYLAISPGRGDLKMADKCGPLPKELNGKAYDDPLVMKAYVNYCRRAIAFFKPDYLAIGIEVNEIVPGRRSPEVECLRGLASVHLSGTQEGLQKPAHLRLVHLAPDVPGSGQNA